MTPSHTLRSGLIDFYSNASGTQLPQAGGMLACPGEPYIGLDHGHIVLSAEGEVYITHNHM